ncbi:MAG TPA: hypothetical protein IAB11_02720 [Candidatus Ornithoclostridium faecavium]|nr:hypothetical protein [Candidatus Ornithoclostridium faecavium]
MKKKILLFSLIIALTITLCACTDQGLRGGYLADDENNTDELPLIRCGYMSDKTTFEITDVTLTFCYGVAGPVYSWPNDYFNSFTTNKVVIQFRTDDETVYECKTIDDTLFSEKYEIFKDKKGVPEEFTIPAEAFNEETGVVMFDVIQYGIKQGETEWEEIERGITGIHYRKNNRNTVELSNKPFD